MRKIKRAVISVSNKEGVVELCRELQKYGIEIISTGGTAARLRENSIEVTDVSEVTGFPEMLDGRVKTLHPHILGGILAQRDKEKHKQELEKQRIETIDLVVLNLYPFEEVSQSKESTFEETIENIDIGGPTIIRSAAKNFNDVAVIIEPSDYALIMKKLKEFNGALDLETRFLLAKKAFQRTAEYDSTISTYLKRIELDDSSFQVKHEDEIFPDVQELKLPLVQILRYGENPHQRAALYQEANPPAFSIVKAKQYQGKQLSFNNILDFDAALCLISEFKQPFCAILKHTNPCGAALGSTSLEAYVRARECDPVSAFGSVIGFNCSVDKATAQEITSTFVEGIIAPSYESEALEILATKKNLRVLELPILTNKELPGMDYRRILGGFLIQERDNLLMEQSKLNIPTKRKPTDEEEKALFFAWRIVKHIKSNAILFATAQKTAAVGAGQMSRVDSVKLAVAKSTMPLRGTVLASDAFFPFRDGIDEAAKAGATAIIQPGGSIRDSEVIKAADEHNMAMIFTCFRHFRH
jgi:phosphoribosylaminoimidazolecarboxamide formyltransferase/IMP cyclohydrolase